MGLVSCPVIWNAGDLTCAVCGNRQVATQNTQPQRERGKNVEVRKSEAAENTKS